MSLKRTRSSKTTLEDPILIDEEVKERFDSIFKHQPMMPEKSFDLKSNDLMLGKEIHDCAKKKAGSAYFPSLIISLCLRACVKTQANLKGQHVQGCITNYDLERLVERVHELNQGELEEPTEPDIEESIVGIGTEANSITDTEEEESDKELCSPKPIEGFATPEPRVELEEEPIRLSV
ncbi:hypothetical protein PVK06_027001 [Gossypium arboreum]|uniref:Uncharacterized protein n=1 Tax=Gossypium arboreum TaxID=29729 RepID=A0ABR0NZ70_GOSAR|nr:hypothetical protein PVK06_027001 [Gossypium arboreum]